MPPSTPLSTPLRAWRCPQCTLRTFSTSTQRLAVGPEHPRYVEVPEPPQQTSPYRPLIKGTLPVPRDIFSGPKARKRKTPEAVAQATPLPKRQVHHEEGSREAWSQRMSEVRRRNLQEGTAALRERRTTEIRRLADRGRRVAAEREELLSRPEREDERLTTPSHNLDLQQLMHGPLPDPTRAARLAHKANNLTIHTTTKRTERLDHLHTLYMNARHFIVSPSQLDEAVDKAFGTAEQPVVWNGFVDRTGRAGSQASMWAHGKPATVQDMLNRANRVGGRTAMEGAGGREGVVAERVRRLGEVLTGGKMED